MVWAFLIVRAVQGESLVGNRQFWVTRPYNWKKLLLAKVVFVLTFVNIPLLFSQCFMLTKAGFSVSPHSSGLLWLQWDWILILNLSVLTLATVTASVGQFILALFCVLLFVIAGASLDSIIPNAGVAPDSFLDSLEPALLAVTALGVIVWQYSRRRTGQSRLALIGAGAAILAMLVFTPFRLLIDRAYPPAVGGEQWPVQLAFDPVKPALNGGFLQKGNVQVRIPLLVSGISNSSMVQINATRVSVGLSGVREWISNWQSYGVSLYLGQPHSQVDLAIDRKIFERVKDSPAEVGISFALTLYQGGESTRVIAEGAGFTVPGEGKCSLTRRFSNAISCSFPLKKPFSLVSLRAEDLTCPPPPGATPISPGATAHELIWNMGSSPAEFGLDPVAYQPLYFTNWDSETGRDSSRRVCPGTLFTFTSLHVAQRVRSDLAIDGIRLADYRLTDSLVGSFGIAAP